MFPTPATTRWSSSATLTATFRFAQALASAVASNAGESGSGPSERNMGWVASPPRGTRSISPNRRGSLKVTSAPDDISNTTWSCFGLSVDGGAPNRPGPSCSASTRNQPDMPRCTSSVSPDDNVMSRNFARRSTAATR